MPRRALELTIIAHTGKAHVPFLRKHLRAAWEQVAGAPGELSIALVGNARMSALHAQFLGISGPTDVLTFPLETDPRGRVTSGEIVVCVPYAQRQARRRGIIAKDELLLYCIHGLLHLSGYDDTTRSGYHRMHAAEDRLLTRLGIGPVFHSQPRDRDRRPS
ncbi:MAG TPA: rRNA maturation RNase YbeY [Tepidisphaeraceae bacterium]|nr:rRNA maturation RNase YbeY [Tepidisphaeraceae bacterium]